ELELSAKGLTRRERVLEAYSGDGRFDVVLYLVDRTDVARRVESSAARLGISDMVRVQWFREPAPGVRRGVERTAERPGDQRRAVAGGRARARSQAAEL